MQTQDCREVTRVRLMLTCLCDAFFGEVGIATVRILEHLGLEVEFPPDQTCCGQPPFNSGDWVAARKVASYCRQHLMHDDLPVIVPSGSCAAMVREGYPMLNPGYHPSTVYELGEFLVRVRCITRWERDPHIQPKARKVAYHRACHGRGLGLTCEHETLLASLSHLQLMNFAQQEQCCGFGGAFSANHSFVSSKIGIEKLRHIVASGADTLVSSDMGCLMHLNGLIEREKLALSTVHFAELLAEVIP